MEYREILTRDSPFWEKCARHEHAQTARNIGFTYLCDACVVRLVSEALNGRPPFYHGETVDGYCGLCNERKRVTLRQWFACGICWNVVLAYQRAVASPQALRDFWRDHVTPVAPEFEASETGAVKLTPYRAGGKTKRDAAGSLEDSDFIVTERIAGVAEPRFHVELKAGPGSIDTMREFQLDVNDFNDVIGVAHNTRLPVYLVHVQLESEYLPPTRRTKYAGMWWTDVLTLGEHQKRIARRRDESKQAVYFHSAAFRPMDTFPDQVTARGFEALGERMRDNPPEFVG